tara:strand:- start:73 stop:789 length:717 start_codon:yes stop_codon:yes gene_type:complete
MNLQVYSYHKSGTMFLYKLFNTISKINNIQYYSCNNIPSNNIEYYNDTTYNKIICPIRSVPTEFDNITQYIIHYRNPLDTMISEYYSFGFIHNVPKDNKYFIERRNKIQLQTIDEYCTSNDTLDVINTKYNNQLNWIKLHGNKKNVFISHYDKMYYHFDDWLKDIMSFLKLDYIQYNYILNKYKDEFNNKNDKYNPTHLNLTHHRSGLSKQYLVELKKESIDYILTKLSPEIIDFYIT